MISLIFKLKQDKAFFYIMIINLLMSDIGAHAQIQYNESDEGKLITLMTYNLKYASPSYKPSWEVRRKMQVDLFRKYKPDIIATQEGLKEQIDYLSEQLPEYVVIGEGRQGGDDDEHMAIFYKKDKFRLRELNSFALSETPEILGSGPKVNPRMVTWARLAFINKTKNEEKSLYPIDYRGHWENTKEFYVLNTHLFNGRIDTLARLNASKLIMKRIKKFNRFGAWTEERALFLMGDFNSKPDGAVYKTFVGDGNSRNQFSLIDCIEGGSGIDWILYKGNVKVLDYEQLDYNVNGAYPSDHKPILVNLIIN